MGTHEKLACIDLEGVLIPELWPKIAVHTGIKALFITTREFPDYDALIVSASRCCASMGSP